mgnify:FL=1
MKGHIVPYGKIADSTDFGALLRQKRREAGLNQYKVAGLSGVGMRFLSELERGKPTVELGRALRVARRLGLDIWLLPRGEAPGKASDTGG